MANTNPEILQQNTDSQIKNSSFMPLAANTIFVNELQKHFGELPYFENHDDQSLAQIVAEQQDRNILPEILSTVPDDTLRHIQEFFISKSYPLSRNRPAEAFLIQGGMVLETIVSPTTLTITDNNGINYAIKEHMHYYYLHCDLWGDGNADESLKTKARAMISKDYPAIITTLDELNDDIIIIAPDTNPSIAGPAQKFGFSTFGTNSSVNRDITYKQGESISGITSNGSESERLWLIAKLGTLRNTLKKHEEVFPNCEIENLHIGRIISISEFAMKLHHDEIGQMQKTLMQQNDI